MRSAAAKGISEFMDLGFWETIKGQPVAKANNYQAVPDKGGGRRIIKTARLREYERRFAAQCRKYRGAGINFPFSLTARVFFRSAASDLDNALKTLLDCLQYAGAITNDNLCAKLEAEKNTDEDNPRIEYKLERHDLPPRGLFAEPQQQERAK